MLVPVVKYKLQAVCLVRVNGGDGSDMGRAGEKQDPHPEDRGEAEPPSQWNFTRPDKRGLSEVLNPFVRLSPHDLPGVDS